MAVLKPRPQASLKYWRRTAEGCQHDGKRERERYVSQEVTGVFIKKEVHNIRL
jgi:hypothetical protein